MGYDLDQHRHRFSVWAAARAAQRGLAGGLVETLGKALEDCGVVDDLKSTRLDDIDASRFDALHRRWCNSIIGFLSKAGVRNVTFGRAAKLIAIYLKSVVVLGPASETAFAQIAHPPIDRNLLRNLAGSTVPSAKPEWESINWTKLCEEQYYELIEQLRQVLGPNEPFWALERFWTVTSGADEE